MHAHIYYDNGYTGQHNEIGGNVLRRRTVNRAKSIMDEKEVNELEL